MMAQPIQMRHDVQNSLWYEVSPASDAMQIVETLPEKYRKQARDIINKLGDKLKISSEGKVIYDTNTVSDSYFRDMLLWHLDSEKYPKPYLFRRELNTEKTYTFILCIVQYTYTRAYTRAYTQAYTPRRV